MTKGFFEQMADMSFALILLSRSSTLSFIAAPSVSATNLVLPVAEKYKTILTSEIKNDH